ncbi:hypothetical protein [Nautilia sp.]
MVKVICIGNRFAYPDNFGILIYEKLKKLNIPNTEIIEGGVGGMSLAPYFEDENKILIIDYGVTDKKILTKKDIDQLEIKEYTHSTALLYLLKCTDRYYTLYTCNEPFDPENIEKYLYEITEFIKVLNEH